ncbi:5'-methylthioadenosine phosphorylase [Thiohalorhabdus denitrificans]|uniref:S-methyl-5'-thioadenosine phosphorylase n=1 Tax=Thiohalorhabdus denitrificans TaxID=381306 RepID=A0A0P9GJW0_9GAMM|nr:S-methyl-5'-thioadenosine phosphorylase [Thiohalorhabdus denitrificans]KPV40406.1 5'-methylthioadenosine phosphorylase [Thiohalorhabdus denitrificans]SCY59844.1 5'-methylthioadenosine phosphorylase [Thiohalorhabdus denitrificans]
MSDDGQRPPMLGVIGGSGVYDITGLEQARWEQVETPFGDPSDHILVGELEGLPVAFLPRHGRGHPLPPSGVNYRANIDALKRLGVTDVLSLSAVGSLREELAPGTFVLVDQFIDRTIERDKSFFGPGLVAHVSMAEPVCNRLADLVERVAVEEELPVRRGGTYLAMEGPQFSSRAESEMYRAWGCDVVGMTNMPEAKLAREAELCYATVAMVTDFDCWHPDHGNVEVADVIRVLQANASKARSLVEAVAESFGHRPDPCPQGCDRVLDTALITMPQARDPERLRCLDAVAGRVLTNDTE